MPFVSAPTLLRRVVTDTHGGALACRPPQCSLRSQCGGRHATLNAAVLRALSRPVAAAAPPKAVSARGYAPSGLICRLPLSSPRRLLAPLLYGRVVTAVPRPTFIRSLSVPRCRAFHYSMCSLPAPNGALARGFSRKPPLCGLLSSFGRSLASFATLVRCPAPTARPRRARAPKGRAPLSSGAPLLRAPSSAPDGASPSLRSGLRVRQVAR